MHYSVDVGEIRYPGGSSEVEIPPNLHPVRRALKVKMGGAQPGQFDVVDCKKTATLDGRLEVRLLYGFMPAANDSFKFLTATTQVTGTFDTLSLPALDGGLAWVFTVNANDGTLSVE